jgi:ABC-2 type transport system ATP-binding protein
MIPIAPPQSTDREGIRMALAESAASDNSRAPSARAETRPAITATGLYKRYGRSGRGAAVEALKHIDLTIPSGHIFGLLGPNGAGKSTFINILAGLVNKTEGKATIWGFDIDVNPRNARASIGVVPQEINFDAFFSPAEALEFQAGMYGVPKSERRTDEILKQVGLYDKRNAYARSLSGGMKRRLMVAKAMVHNPPILVLDEPTAGVDVELRQQLWENMRAMRRAGMTIVLTTHYLEEAQLLCDEIAIINHGQLVCCEPTPQLLRRIEEKELIISVDSDLKEVPAALTAYNARLEAPRTLAIQFNRAVTTVSQILSSIQQDCHLTIVDISTREADLEDIFLQLTRET